MTPECWSQVEGLFLQAVELSPEERDKVRWFEQSLTIWRDWTKRNVAASYAGRRARRILTLLDQ